MGLCLSHDVDQGHTYSLWANSGHAHSFLYWATAELPATEGVWPMKPTESGLSSKSLLTPGIQHRLLGL